jgi:predicted transcriptional regulator
MKIKEKIRAKFLRRKGYSIHEISNLLKVSKSSASKWVNSVVLDEKAKGRIQKRMLLGRLRSRETVVERSRKRNEKINKDAGVVVNDCHLNDSSGKILCALIYLCEGSKCSRSVNFVNSDPKLISTFLSLLRRNFLLDEKKLRISMHLHRYHNESKQLLFWSKVTRIPKRQFNKTYSKYSTGRYKKEGYQGCVSVRYHDTILASSLLAIGKKFMNSMGL